MSEKSLEEKIVEQGVGEAKKYIKSDEFKGFVKNQSREEIVELISRSEIRAKRWAAIAAIFVFGVFFIILSIEYAQVRERQADLYVKYSEATELIQKIKLTVAELNTSTNTSLEKIAKTVKGYENEVANFKTNTSNTMTQINGEVKIHKEHVLKLQKSIEAAEKRMASDLKNQVGVR